MGIPTRHNGLEDIGEIIPRQTRSCDATIETHVSEVWQACPEIDTINHSRV